MTMWGLTWCKLPLKNTKGGKTVEINKTLEDGTQIKYTESFWLGEKNLIINGTPAHKLDKKTFRRFGEIDMSTGLQNNIDYTVKGSYIFGVKLISNKGEQLVLTKNAWYDWIFIVLCYVSIIFGGLFMGAIGGVLSALLACAAVLGVLAVARSKMHIAAKIVLQLLISLAVNALWGGLFFATVLFLL